MKRPLFDINNIILIVILILDIYISRSYGIEVVRILVFQPELFVSAEIWSNNYQEKVNEFFYNKNVNHPILSEVFLEFEFIEYMPANSSVNMEYHDDVGFIIDELKNGAFDMMILDERILFCDNSFIEHDFLFEYDVQKPSHKLLQNLSKFQKTDPLNLNFHNEKVLKDGYIDNTLYALPYDIDFDLLYYYNYDPFSENLVNKMESLTWDELVNELSIPPSHPLKISLALDNDLLDFYVEYINCHYNLTTEYDPLYYKVLYNETSEELFDNFYNTIMSYTEEFIESSLYLQQNDAFLSFMNGESIFYWGKASNHFIFESNEKISSSLPPKHITSMNKRYLILNKNSELDKTLLWIIAKELTSKEMQLFRAEKFGNIPTFNITQKETDPDIKHYCETHQQLCQHLEIMKPIHVKDIFSGKYTPAFFEIIFYLLDAIRYFLENNDRDDMINELKNTFELVTVNMGVFNTLSFIVTGIFSIIKHPYMKIISPIFCILIIFGCIINMNKLLFEIPPYWIGKIKLFYIFGCIRINLIYLPMFVVTYRIYRICRSLTIIPNGLNNKILFGIITVLLSIQLIYKIIIIFVSDFYYVSYTDIFSGRYPSSNYSYSEFHDEIHRLYLYIVFFCLVYMIVATKKEAKRFGDISYSYIIVILNICDFMTDTLLIKISQDNYSFYFFLLVFLNCLINFICIYILVGTRLLFIMIAPPEYELSLEKNYDLKDFIPITFSKNKYFEFISRIKKNILMYISSKDNINKFGDYTYSKSNGEAHSYYSDIDNMTIESEFRTND
ncbi:hypothetical protein BCR32DRAFT_263935 [Anaeromyces robustus]|uniref:G-protein coupled receptors family 3 profile domain-containing protein n=1 Tax=Anaeromyces robustus TaxID=1754192 RepID=A0A1Y1XQ69_9FUNG|nr:hypothetical protein BCR32DRAFT_263935 [Anaeromyces robustus]|eukprot:ORX87881.1 hypothetical protein BCR32DRAFT_263935 [Anaeromyces robustus]